eukprot:1307368-Rhodomonas_salina.1
MLDAYVKEDSSRDMRGSPRKVEGKDLRSMSTTTVNMAYDTPCRSDPSMGKNMSMWASMM